MDSRPCFASQSSNSSAGAQPGPQALQVYVQRTSTEHDVQSEIKLLSRATKSSADALSIPQEIVGQIFQKLAQGCRVGEIIQFSSANRFLYQVRQAWRCALLDGFKLGQGHSPFATPVQGRGLDWLGQTARLLILCLDRKPQMEDIPRLEDLAGPDELKRPPVSTTLPRDPRDPLASASQAPSVPPHGDDSESAALFAYANAKAMLRKAASDKHTYLKPIQLILCSLCVLSEEGDSSAISLFNTLPHLELLPYLQQGPKHWGASLNGKVWQLMVRVLVEVLDDLPQDCGVKAQQLMQVLISLRRGMGLDLYSSEDQAYYVLMNVVLASIHKLKDGELQGPVLNKWVGRFSVWALPKLERTLLDGVEHDDALRADVEQALRELPGNDWQDDYASLLNLVLNLFSKQWKSDPGKRASFLLQLQGLTLPPDYASSRPALRDDPNVERKMKAWWRTQYGERNEKDEPCVLS